MSRQHDIHQYEIGFRLPDFFERLFGAAHGNDAEAVFLVDTAKTGNVLLDGVLEDLAAEAPERTQVEKIVREATRCKEIVQGLLEFSRHMPSKMMPLKINAILEEAQARGTLDGLRVEEAAIASHLYTSGLPDPDLIIRTSGEKRISNFLLWQAAYAEFYFTDTLWPDFAEKDLLAALIDYQGRQRRFGLTQEQLVRK